MLVTSLTVELYWHLEVPICLEATTGTRMEVPGMWWVEMWSTATAAAAPWKDRWGTFCEYNQNILYYLIRWHFKVSEITKETKQNLKSDQLLVHRWDSNSCAFTWPNIMVGWRRWCSGTRGRRSGPLWTSLSRIPNFVGIHNIAAKSVICSIVHASFEIYYV